MENADASEIENFEFLPLEGIVESLQLTGTSSNESVKS